MKHFMPLTRTARRIATACALAAVVGVLPALGARADSVAQISTGVRISRATAGLIDPQGRPGGSASGTDTAVRPGDVLTFVVHFTPVPNGGIRGLGGYVTVYIPRNTEVVGARIVDGAGNTVAPHRGGFASDGLGPRGANNYTSPLVEGSLSQLYADTGIFYSTDARTTRVPDGSLPNETFITLFNGLLMNPAPTAAGQLAPILGAIDPYAHNQWDVIQAYAFGVGNGAINDRGQGNTPDTYGSAVAGPDTWYPYEASYSGDLTMPIVLTNIAATSTTGPWMRIQTYGAEIGRRGNLPPMPDPGLATRIGVPAVDNNGALLGVLLNGANALPAYSGTSPSDPYTRAVRFAVGELLVGQEYLSEFSLRVLDTPLDPVSGSDVVCAEVFGGDASSETTLGTKDGKDNTWRYFLPAPSCVSLNLLFDLNVDHLAALQGDTLHYTLAGKNLSLSPHTNVVVRHCYDGGEVTFVSASNGGIDRAATGCPASHNREVAWTIPTWAPGAEFDYTADFTVTGGVKTIGHAVFTSDQLPAPGFSTVAFTVVDSVSIVNTTLTATPSVLANASGTIGYELTVDNTGTGTATFQQIIVTVPNGFTYVNGSATLGGTTLADPTINGSILTFTTGIGSVMPGGSAQLAFETLVTGSATVGVNTTSVDLWFTDPFRNETVNDSRAGLAEVLIGVVRSATPVITSALAAGDAQISGTTSEAVGTTIRVFVNGIESAQATSNGSGAWTATVSPLFGGQRVSASAQAPNELEGPRSAEIGVLSISGVAACGDGMDNDGDTLTDFPNDPDCTSTSDPDETHTPRCADGIDNDNDQQVDFGNDDGCSSLLDDDEQGTPECSDSSDNDNDQLIDFPNDPGCSSADDVSENDVPQCADGEDNDGDGQFDFPADGDCTNSTDDQEATVANLTDGGTPTNDAGNADAGVGLPDAAEPESDAGAGAIADLGGVAAPDTGGCGCTVVGQHEAPRAPLIWTSLALALVLTRTRTRARRSSGTPSSG